MTMQTRAASALPEVRWQWPVVTTVERQREADRRNHEVARHLAVQGQRPPGQVSAADVAHDGRHVIHGRRHGGAAQLELLEVADRAPLHPGHGERDCRVVQPSRHASVRPRGDRAPMTDPGVVVPSGDVVPVVVVVARVGAAFGGVLSPLQPASSTPDSSSARSARRVNSRATAPPGRSGSGRARSAPASSCRARGRSPRCRRGCRSRR